MKITDISINRPVTTFMFFLAVILLGIVSLGELSVDLLPDISYPRLSVITQYPGVAPEEMEALVTRRLEASVMRIPGLRRVESVSEEGMCYMTLEFIWGTDMDFALLHTREKLDSAQLPEDVKEPVIIPLDPQSQPIMVLSVSGKRPLLEVKEFTEEVIKPRLEQIEGIGSAEVAGGVEREIQVEVDPRLLAVYDLDLQDISQRIDAFNKNLRGGTIRKGRFKYALRIKGEFENLEEIGEVSLKVTQEGGVVRLQDVARIKDSLKERQGITRLNRKESIGVLVRKESGANTVKVTQKARQIIDEIREQNKQVELLVVSEQADYIQNAISSVLNAIIFGAILAFLVLIVFLQDLKTPLIIAVAIPIAIIATFNLLYFMDISLNIMSLGGLALGVGMLVDNSIVVSESVFRHKNMGKNLLQAASTGTKEVGMAVTASTLTTISVFLPVIYVHGVAGQLFKDQALTVTFALLCSLIVSLTLLPMLSSRKFKTPLPLKEKTEVKKDRNRRAFKRIKSKWKYVLWPLLAVQKLLYLIPKFLFMGLGFLTSFLGQVLALLIYYLYTPLKPIVNFIFRKYNLFYQKFAHRYHQFLHWSLENKGKVLSGCLVFLTLTILLFTHLPRELMPKPETSSFEVQVKTPIGYSLEQTSEVMYMLENWLVEKKYVQATFSQIGIVSGMESMNPDVSLNSAKLYVETHHPSQTDQAVEDLRSYLKNFPGLNHSILKEQSTLAQFLAFSTAQVGLKIKGENLNKLEEIAENLVQELKEIKGIADINTNLGQGKPEFLIKVKKGAVEKYGITPEEIGNFLVNAVRGRVSTQFKEMEKKYDIRVQMEEATKENVENLLDIQVPYKHSSLPLRELVSYEITRGPQEIRRENQEREVLVAANLQGTKISEVVPEIKEKIDTLSLPSDYRVEFSGEQEEMQKSFRSLTLALLLAVFLVYMIMAAQFESLLHPFLILFTLPMGLTGAVWALFMTGQSVNIISVIGMIVLAGIVVNDAIVKIDYTNQLRQKGMNLRESIMEASRVRLRPILMTTVTTALGLFPMSLGLGRGAELQQPLAISIIGGLILATFLTLILIPLVYELAEKSKSREKA